MSVATSIHSSHARGASRWDTLSRGVRAAARALSGAELESLRPMLWADVASEHDARYLRTHLQSSGAPFGDGFRRALERWSTDEAEHEDGFRAVVRAAFGVPAAELDARLAWRARGVDFGPLAHLMEDEFAILLLLAYDELATVRAYRANRARYARLGPELVRFVAEVTADEGRHFAAFLGVLRDAHADRLHEGAAQVARIRASEGIAYANTFVLDHDADDPVWTDAIFDDAARVLTTHVESFARRMGRR